MVHIVLTLVVNYERDTTNNVVTTQQEKYTTPQNAALMHLRWWWAFSTTTQDFYSMVCKHTSGFIFAVLVSNYVAFASSVIDHFLL